MGREGKSKLSTKRKCTETNIDRERERERERERNGGIAYPWSAGLDENERNLPRSPLTLSAERLCSSMTVRVSCLSSDSL